MCLALVGADLGTGFGALLHIRLHDRLGCAPGRLRSREIYSGCVYSKPGKRESPGAISPEIADIFDT
jgi:hypothetical protein